MTELSRELMACGRRRFSSFRSGPVLVTAYNFALDDYISTDWVDAQADLGRS